jgi:SAM-dependent methyltransferase
VLGPTGHVTACDISPAMLAIARSVPSEPGSAPIDYIESPAAPLAVTASSQDVVTCQQGLQFVPDRGAAVAEMSRALRPGGRVALAVWASIEECPSMAALERAIRDELGDEPADRYRSGPWGLPDGTALAGLLDSSGFADIRVQKHELRATFTGGAPQLRDSLAASAVADDVARLSTDDTDALNSRIEHYLQPLTVGGAVEAVWHANIATATKASG